jgi:hypothetical protein
MIETLFGRASSLARLLEPPLGSYLESLAQTLQGQSYSREVIRSYVYAAHRFGEWLNKQGLPLSDLQTRLMIEQSIENVRCLTGCRRNDLGVVRSKLVA